jgi:mannose-6-phosphate isomerase
MHLLEALLAWHEATGEPEWAARAARIGDLFATTLFDPTTGTLAERFNTDWSRAPPVVVEPGHHFEWVWLLNRLSTVTARDYAREADALFAFASAHGLEANTRRAIDEIDDHGTVVMASSRLWPQTELLKAYLARAERGDVDAAAIERTVANIFTLYLDPAPQGCWRDRLDANDTVMDEPIPASTLYHLFLAFAELLRLRPLLEAKA